MRRILWSLSLCTLALAVAGEPGPTETSATSLTIAEPAFRDPQVLVAMSMPPQFDLVLDRDMPTPGWSFTVDEVAVDLEHGRIVARISEVAPQGASAQVITETTCRVPLGKLPGGTYWLELWLRRGTALPHTPAQALVIHAR
jgi:hypothetical protein